MNRCVSFSIASVTPKFNTSKRNKEHKIYPYLLLINPIKYGAPFLELTAAMRLAYSTIDKKNDRIALVLQKKNCNCRGIYKIWVVIEENTNDSSKYYAMSAGFFIGGVTGARFGKTKKTCILSSVVGSVVGYHLGKETGQPPSAKKFQEVVKKPAEEAVDNFDHYCIS